jgi:2-oxoglutarate dehydrogenase E2 component (dihydrolipoamide succinyltransferase)
VSEGTISAVLKAVGDKVAVDEAVAQLETDKVTIDVKSPHAGAISAIAVGGRRDMLGLQALTQ